MNRVELMSLEEPSQGLVTSSESSVNDSPIVE